MSGVSITSDNTDLSALVGGGDAFLARIKQFQEEQAKAKAALEQLNLGKDLAASHAAAHATQQSAIDMVEKAKADAVELADEATRKAEEIVKEGQAQADAILAAAQQKATALENEVAAGKKAFDDWSTHNKAEADKIMADAVAAKAKADKLLADNQRAATELASEKAQLEDAKAFTNRLQGTLQNKLNAISKAAASQ